MKKTCLSIVLLALFFACKKEENIAEPPPAPDEFEAKVAKHLTLARTPLDYRVALPSWASGFYPAAQANAAIAQLGRVIFYDKSLSKDGAVACATCHRQENAFAEPLAVSEGVFGQHTTRNSLALGNTMWFGGYLGLDSAGKAQLPLFWDVRANSIAEQSRGAFTNPIEMGMTMSEIVQSIENQEFYPYLFRQAWGDTMVTETRIFTALSHFMSAMSAQKSKFDTGLAALGATGTNPDLSPNFSNFSLSENLGKQIYLQHCESCHGSLTTPQKIFEANNGLESPYVDKGKGAISGKFYENGIFKVPGLRNVALTAPYMHDGRFASLEQVIEHYDSGVKQVFGLHGDLLQFNPGGSPQYSPKRLNLSAAEKLALKAFLETLTDTELGTAERFANPFK